MDDPVATDAETVSPAGASRSQLRTDLCVTVRSRSHRETEAIAGVIAQHLQPRDVVVLTGELGGGKTCFVRGAVRGLGSSDHVTSPTFAIVHEYQGRCAIVHADCYRLAGPSELLDIGFDEVLDRDAIAFLEWGELAINLLSVAPLIVAFEQLVDMDHRDIHISSLSDVWSLRIESIAGALDMLSKTERR